MGLADESLGTTEKSFMDWKEGVLQDLGAILPLTSAQSHTSLVSKFWMFVSNNKDVYLGELSAQQLYGETGRAAYNAQNPHPAPIALSQTLSSVPNRNCVHMEFDLSTIPALRYQASDHLAVWPVNSENEVERLFRMLGLNEDERKKPIMITTKG